MAWPEHQAFTELCLPLAKSMSEILFDCSAPILPVIITPVSPYGRSIGFCAMSDDSAEHHRASRIWIKESAVRDGSWPLILIHEMLHAKLSWMKLVSAHNKNPWCEEIVRISALLGREINAAPIRQKRINGKVTWFTPPEVMTRTEIAGWPHSVPGLTGDDIIKACNI